MSNFEKIYIGIKLFNKTTTVNPSKAVKRYGGAKKVEKSNVTWSKDSDIGSSKYVRNIDIISDMKTFKEISVIK